MVRAIAPAAVVVSNKDKKSDALANGNHESYLRLSKSEKPKMASWGLYSCPAASYDNY